MTEESYRACDFCKEKILASSKKCIYCESDIIEADTKITPTNEHTLEWEDGIYIGALLEGQPHGKGSWKHKDGRFYIGQWAKGKKSGYGKFIYPSGVTYEGEWQDDDYIGRTTPLASPPGSTETTSDTTQEPFVKANTNTEILPQLSVNELRTYFFRYLPIIITTAVVIVALLIYSFIVDTIKASNLRADLGAEYDAGISEYHAGNYGQALVHLEGLIEENPDYEDAQAIIRDIYLQYSDDNYNKAIQAFEAENYNKAKSFFELVIHEDPNYELAQNKIEEIAILELSKYYYLALDAFEDENYEKALDNFEKVLEGSEYYDAALKKIEETKPLLVKDHIDKAKKLLSEDEFKLTRMELRAALKHDPGNEEATALIERSNDLEAAYEARLKQQVIEDYKAKCKTYEYRVLDKDADKLSGEYIRQRGQIIQIMEETSTTVIRLSVTRLSYRWSINDIVYVVYPGATEVYVDDVVTVWGQIAGQHTYTSVAGYNITVPRIDAKYIEK